MHDLLVSVITFALLILSAWVGRLLHRRLPETLRTRETIETMQLVIGMLVTFAALVLSLLTASVKTSYDHARRDRDDYALRLTALDDCLRDYGPSVALIRADLARYTAAVIASTWPHEPPPKGISFPNTAGMPVVGASPVLGELMDRIGQRIRMLNPMEAVAARAAEDCRLEYRDTAQARLAVIEDANTTFSTPLFCILVFWLMAAFFALGLAAPRNRIATSGIVLCAVSLSCAMFVITDLSRPYRGLLAISSHDMREALAHMTQP